MCHTARVCCVEMAVFVGVSAIVLLLYVSHVGRCVAVDPGLPLFLTPYLEAGRIQEARIAAQVSPLLNGVVSYSGYLTVNKRFDSNLFFWFFPSEHSWRTQPVLLWLQGGPGASSLLGLLFENGPLQLTKTGLKKNPYAWSVNYNIIYLDNPVGTGFSFTNATEGYMRTQKSIGKAIYSTLLQFFLLFPELKSADFFLTGESYAGKYIPSAAIEIHKRNRVSKFKINLKGLLIGNGLVDPINYLHYGEYLHQLGLINVDGRKLFEEYEASIRQLINKNQWSQATDMFSKLILDYYYSENNTVFANLTGLEQHYNYIKNDDGSFDMDMFVKNNTIRKILHVGNKTFNDGKTVALNLKVDFMQSVKTTVEALLGHYDILFYNGQLDIICPYALTERVIQGFDWGGKDSYVSAQRHIWRVNGEVAGYCRSGGRLMEVLVRNAGHLVPTDQPAWAFDLIYRFISGWRCV